jgi:uncharacterized protein YhaN
VRITGLSIDGFGVFSDFQLRDIPPGITVVFGPNEAGKTTLLTFIRGVFFGFGGRGHEVAPLPLRGGRPGGRIFVEGPGGSWTIEREPGKKKGTLRILRPDGREGTDVELASLLGGVDETLYRHVFAFGLGELSDFAKLDDEGIRDRVFAGGIGGTAPSARQVAAALEAEAGGISRPRATSTVLNQLLDRLHLAESELEKARAASLGYGARAAERLRRESEVNGLDQTREALRSERARYQALLELWPAWADLDRARKELALTESVDVFPPDGKTRRAELEQAIATGKETRNEVVGSLAAIRKDRAALVLDDRLMAQTAALETLRDEAELRRDNMRKLVEARRALAGREQKAREQLMALGSDWTGDRVARIDTSPSRRDEARAHRDRLARMVGAVKTVESRTDGAREGYESAKRKRDSAATGISLTEPPKSIAIEAQFDVARRVDHLLAEYERLRDRQLEVARGLEVLAQESTRARARLSALGEGWTEEQVLAIDASAARREEGRAIRDRLNTATHDVSMADAEVKAAARTADERRRIRDRIASRLGGSAPEPLSGLDSRLSTLGSADEVLLQVNTLRAKADEQDHRLQDLRRERHAHDVTEIPWSPPAWTGRVLAALAGAAVLGASGVGVLARSVEGTSLLVFTSAILAWMALRSLQLRAERATAERARRSGAELAAASVDEAERARGTVASQVVQLETRFRELADSAGIASASKVELERRRSELTEQRAARIAWDQGQRDLVQAELELDEASQAMTRHGEEFTRATSAFAAAHSELKSWRRAIGLPESMSAEGALELLRTADELQALLADLSRRRQGLKEREGVLLPELAQREADLRQLADTVGLASVPSRPDVDAKLAQLAEQRQARTAWDAAHGDFEQQEAKLSDAATEQGRMIDALAKTRKTLEAAQADFSVWKKTLDLPLGASSEGVLDILGAIAAAQELRGDLERDTRDIEDREKAVTNWETSCRDTLAAAGTSVTAERGDALLEQLRIACLRLEEDRKARADAGQAERKIAELMTKARGLTESLSSREDALRALFTSAGAKDDLEFERRHGAFERRRELARIIADREQEIGRRLGRGERAQASSRELSTGEMQVWEGRVATLAREFETVEARRDDVLKGLRDIETELRQLQDSADVASRELEVEAVKTEAREATRRFRVLWLAQTLVRETLDDFVKTRQPSVLAAATGTLASLTGGRYAGIIQDDTAGVAVLEPSGARKSLPQLSRGLAEQVYLSIRLGLVSEFGRNGARLPLIFDDPFVNFDRTRTRATARAIAAFATSGHQVLVFTCHEWVRDIFLEADANAGVVTLPSSGSLARDTRQTAKPERSPAPGPAADQSQQV